MEIKEYIEKHQNECDKNRYIEKEYTRIKKYKGEDIASIFKTRLKKNNLKCYYCKTDIRVIQQLIIKRKINPRKRGRGYSGIHFEIEHLRSHQNTETHDSKRNIQTACYYCNNDKSNTIKAATYKRYFGKKRGEAFKELYKSLKLGNISNLKYYHNK
jgi:5-methylcytosine-specific restriction endonuclease McrA